ncbi:hypothetical protein BN938_1263 [Mucinivorans hirudinis]|uniref:Uncharacterized protein n=1 Tax=Mucinivorans hirudinis TaxID=1433126 RepID=A0A060R7R0_9BACT|nr:hypothetical protein BN938_1263 [Mucinivorans hirudinis]
MKRVLLLATILLSLNGFAQNKYADFVARVNDFARSDLSMLKYELRQNYDISYVNLNDIYAEFGSSWGNVAMALMLAHVAKESYSTVLVKSNRTKPTDWSKIAREMKVDERKVDSVMNKHLSSWLKK